MFITSGDVRFSQNGVAAVIVPNRQLIESWSHEGEIEGKSYEEICRLPQLRERIITGINQVALSENLRSFEIPNIIIIEPKKWTAENGFMTSSSKFVHLLLSILYLLTMP
jgi:long-chain acyl-CoA synthetase